MKHHNEKVDSSSRVTKSVLSPSSIVYKECDVRKSSLGDLVSLGDNTTSIDVDYESNIQINRRNFLQSSCIGRFTYTGTNTCIRGASVGRFCSISWNVSIGGKNHDVEHVTTSTLWAFHNLDGNKIPSEVNYGEGRAPCIIGNDVWISAHSVILRGVTIGSGAVIGAGAVVCSDVEPYTIVAGVPAKPIRKRFDDAIIEKLLALAWWDWPIAVIREHKELIYKEKVDMDVIMRLQAIKDRLK